MATPPFPRLVWLAIRPKTLPLAATPVLVGTALAVAEGAVFRLAIFLAALIAAFLIQIGANLYNDAADYERGNDRSGRLGPPRITASGWATPRQVKHAAASVFLVAFLIGIYLARAGGWPIIVIGLASLLAGWLYSGGRRPLAYTPYGEITVWLFFGVLAVVGSHWLQAQRPSSSAWIAGAALGLPAAAVLLVNNLRDRDSDRAVGRRTLAAVIGDARCRRLYAILLIASYLLIFLLARFHAGAWLAFLSLPLALRLIQRMREDNGSALNEVLAATARQQFVFGFALAIGFLL